MREGVDGARLVRVDHDLVDDGRELPVEDADSPLPGGRAPGRAAVARGVEAAAEAGRAAREQACIDDVRPARCEREGSHARRPGDAAGLLPGRAVVVALEEPRARPGAVDADEHAPALRRDRQRTDGALRRDLGRRGGDDGECATECGERASRRASPSRQGAVTGGAVRPRCAPSSSSRASLTAPPTPVGVAIERPA